MINCIVTKFSYYSDFQNKNKILKQMYLALASIFMGQDSELVILLFI